MTPLPPDSEDWTNIRRWYRRRGKSTDIDHGDPVIESRVVRLHVQVGVVIYVTREMKGDSE